MNHIILRAIALAAFGPSALLAQHEQHHGAAAPPVVTSGTVPGEPGQSAFAAIAEIVALLEADSTTDWSRVNIEALRLHLADMDDVVLRSAVRVNALPRGAEFIITGDGRVRDAIRRMVAAHARELDAQPALRASATPAGDGMRLVVEARDAKDGATARRIRALGFAGLLTVGAHHPRHHLELARGVSPHSH